ncbi:DUF4468 domain-containing protein [Undibacterium sp. CY7W]|uniref:DUF4468 domain-containing protein n=1 Tax=Undibacterium rugosum TaxID=2762291 RepID=A0A923I1M7_9BURK|nr:DUF4468 domain-containing protein [Undibacterium rugosum]MBC3934720.1 DUF4468 domain-containing protein [Undibacterium rugosum]
MTRIYALLIVFLSALFCLPECHAAQPLPDSETTVVRIVDASTLSKEKIFTGTKIWIAENFRSAKAVLEYESKDDGILIGNGSMNFPTSGAMELAIKGDWLVQFTMRVDIKEEKFRLSFINITISTPAKATSGGGVLPAYSGPVWNQADMQKIKVKLEGFGDSILNSVTSSKAKIDF